MASPTHDERRRPGARDRSLRRTYPLVRTMCVILVTLSSMAFDAGRVHGQSGLYDVLVSSRGTGSIKRFDASNGAYLGDFIPAQSGGLTAPEDVEIAPNGDIIVTDHFTNQVIRYNRRSGDLVRAYTFGYSLSNPTKMAIGPDGDLYVSQWTSSATVVRFDGLSGNFAEVMTPTIQRPMEPIWDAGGQLHVVSYGAEDVRAFTGGALDRIVTSGVALQTPRAAWFTGTDLLVVDGTAGAVRRFDAATGVYLDDLITGLVEAEGWALGPDGRIYLADRVTHVVNAYNATTGAFEETFLSGGQLNQPNALVFVERLPDFTLELSSQQLTVNGGSGQLTLTIAPDRGLAFPDPIQLRCRDVPSSVACVFSENTVTPGGSAATITVTVRPATGAAVGWGGGWLVAPFLAGALLTFAALGLLAFPPARDESDPAIARRRVRLAPATAIVATMLVAGCGVAEPPEPINADLRIEAVAPSHERSVEFSLTYTP